LLIKKVQYTAPTFCFYGNYLLYNLPRLPLKVSPAILTVYCRSCDV
jgi:hypothetical protein